MALQVRELSVSAGATILGDPHVRWALDRFGRHGITVAEHPDGQQESASAPLRIDILAHDSAEATELLTSRNIALGSERGAYALLGRPCSGAGRVALVAREPAGYAYGLLELGETVAEDEMGAGALETTTLVRAPQTPVRAIGRAFTSARHDMSWYRDEEFWRDYLDMLGENRFNQLDLAFGIAYDFPIHITDAAFLFAYPFFVEVAGYGVCVKGLHRSERADNLALLQFVARESARRGIGLHLGLWTHSYVNAQSPQANYEIEGLDEAHHATYCRDALAALLTECPEIRGITLRSHGESGVPEGTEDFWATLFTAVTETRARGEFTVDLHAKGLTPTIIEHAAKSGARVVVSAKFSAEHLALPYQQASIRELDRLGRQTIASAPDASGEGDNVRDTAHRLMGLSLHSRSATRYSYGDFLALERDHEVIYRIWPGTQKLLMWSDPLFAASYATASRFCGSSGLEVMEPLSFRGRRGSGLHGDEKRSGYRAEVARPWEQDWQKYAETYAVWGRALFGADQYPAPRSGNGNPARARLTAALARASRILPLVTSAHCPSAACVHYWPEIYTIPPVSKQREDGPANVYRGDSLAPVRLGTVSAVDPAIFSSAREFATARLHSRPDGRYSPLDVAQWLVDLSARTEADAAAARALGELDAADELRLSDVEALAKIGTFFAELFATGVSYELFDLTQVREHLAAAARSLESAITVWEDVARSLDPLYVEDLSFGEVAEGRGSWRDRLPAMRAELAQLHQELEAAPTSSACGTPGAEEIWDVVSRRLPPPHAELGAQITAAGSVHVRLVLADSYVREQAITGASLHYRLVNQFEPYATAAMERSSEGHFGGFVPAEYLKQGFAIQYFCELASADGRAARFPGLGAELNEVPYRLFVPSAVR